MTMDASIAARAREEAGVAEGAIQDSYNPMSQAASGRIAAGGEVPMKMLYDLSLPVTIELGRASMTVQEVLQLGRGSVIQLERLAGEPVDIYVGERRFAEGEVVVLGEHFGVRITRFVSASHSAEPEA
ncbi:MAG TPA: flagellar motor switch protein FliN [Gemmatimonadales bacterium]|nr:flagellar motor switch protein FliN [Gemmatimonadales bacterium]